MSLIVVVSCDGTPTDRPGMALERCRAYYPSSRTDPVSATGDAVAHGWRWHPDGRHLCPSCTRARATTTTDRSTTT